MDEKKDRARKEQRRRMAGEDEMALGEDFFAVDVAVALEGIRAAGAR